MAHRIIDAGWPTVLWARRPEVLEPFAGRTVDTAPTPAALAAIADLVCVCVWADDDVRAVLAGPEGVLAGCRPGTVIAIHSTVLPGTCREVEERAASSGVVVLDAPVTGGREVAREGSLTVAVGGDEGTLARCRPVFDTFASTVVHLGPVGTGQLAKLINNALLAANLAMADDALALGAALGLDPEVLTDFLRTGSGRSYGLDIARAARSSAATRQAARPALEKDLDALAAAADEQAGAAPFLRDAAAEAIRRLGFPPPGEQ